MAFLTNRNILLLSFIRIYRKPLWDNGTRSMLLLSQPPQIIRFLTPLTPHLQLFWLRVVLRLELYQFTQVSVHGDGNCMHRAISEQLSHSEKHYAEVRKLLVEQLRSNQELYEERAKRLKRDPEHMGETYIEYVNRKSKDKVWGDPVNRQAAADRFHAKLVCLTSLEHIAILEFFPNGLTEYQRVLYLCSLIGLHIDSMYPRTPHVESCSHCYPLGSPEKKKKKRQRKDTI